MTDLLKTFRSRRRATGGKVAASLGDVALAAGVSTASASRALARPELVSDPVRARVLQAAERLGYVGNAAARFLSSRRSGLIGAVLGEAAEPVAWRILAGADSTLSGHGIGVVVRVASDSTLSDCVRSLVARGVDGLLFVGVSPDAEIQVEAFGPALPWAVCDGESGLEGRRMTAESVGHRGLRLACAYLEQLGHRRIGAIRRQRAGGDQGLQLKERCAPIDYPVDQLGDTERVRAAVRALLDEGTTAIVAGSDAAAAAAVRECRALSLAVPHRVSVVGWGDTELARNFEPPLTSVRIPARASGQTAAEYLVAAIAGQDFRWPELQVKLVIRESTASAPD